MSDGQRILLVDDDRDVRSLAGLVLSGEGFEVVECESGPAALAWLDGSDAPPRVVVLDVQMPEMDGWTVLEHLRSDDRHHSIPVLLCTVKAGERDRDRARSGGADAYLAKPFTIDDLVTSVGNLLGRPRTSVARSGRAPRNMGRSFPGGSRRLPWPEVASPE